MATAKRLIDANVVLAKKFTAGLSDASGNYYGYADVVFADDIENATTVDSVEVVRCKDCKHWDNFDILARKVFPAHWCHKFENLTKDDDFCSYGERRTDG